MVSFFFFFERELDGHGRGHLRPNKFPYAKELCKILGGKLKAFFLLNIDLRWIL